MAIKHIGNTLTVDSPHSGQIKEREIAINTVEPALYTSSDGVDVIKVAEPDIGGTIYKGDTNYDIGDVITAKGPAGSIRLWRCVVAYKSAPGGTDIDFQNELGNWISAEIGGSAWDPDITYDHGDIVVDTTVTPKQTFVSLHDNNKRNNPPASGTDAHWQEIDTVFYNARTGGDANGDGTYTVGEDGSTYGGGRHCPWSSTAGDPQDNPITPNNLGEYPTTNVDAAHPERIGATWYISGLGVDANGDSIEYTIKQGPLIGVDVADGDRVTWVDGVHGSEEWFHTPYPRINGERAGMLWRPTESYLVGDIVMYNNLAYRCIQDNSETVPPNDSASKYNWQRLVRGGIAWEADTTYTPGDIVTYNGETYRAIGGSANNPPDQWGGLWQVLARGGIAWNSLTVYKIGDIVSYGGLVYIAAVTNPTQPSPDNPDWVVLTERGGIEWEDYTYYYIGDIVTYGGTTYRSLTENINRVPSSNPGDWYNIEIPERGGIKYKSGENYFAGDIVSYNNAVYLNRSGEDTTPDGNTSWMNIKTTSVYYDAEVKYVPGSIVIYNGQAYMSRITQVGNPPPSDRNTNSEWTSIGETKFVDRDGDSMYGILNMGGNRVENIGAPNSNDDAIRRDTYATSTTGGTLKTRLSGNDLYITNNGTNP